jgi:hypothetical protein
MRSDPKKPERQLWMVNPDTLGGPVIAKESGYTYNFYQWDPWGAAIVIQQVNLKTKFYPEVAIWTPAQGLQVIAGNGMYPHWLP